LNECFNNGLLQTPEKKPIRKSCSPNCPGSCLCRDQANCFQNCSRGVCNFFSFMLQKTFRLKVAQCIILRRTERQTRYNLSLLIMTAPGC